MAEKNGFKKTNSLRQKLSGIVVQCSRTCLHVQKNEVRLPAKVFSVSLLYNISFCEGNF